MFPRAINIILISLFVIINLPAQESIHSIDKSRNENYTIESPGQSQIFMKSNSQLNKAVFGFLPYWELASANIRLDLLSHIAIFDFLLTEEGSLLEPPGWPINWEHVIISAQSSGVKVLMTISNLPVGGADSNIVSNLINNESAQKLFFNDVKTIISSQNLDGVILDFEAIKLNERGDPINNFTRQLRDSLDTWFNGQELSFATPAVNWGSRWKLNELAEICDYLFIMGYDYHGSWSTNAGPVAPLDGLAQNYHNTIENDYAGIDPDKLILGVPYYGAEWFVDNSNPYTSVIPESQPDSNWIGHVDYRNVDWDSFSSYVNFDDISQSTYYLTENGSKFNLLWIDNASSLFFKYDFILDKELKGVGIWSLGKDGNRNELWNLIEEKFTDSTTLVEVDELKHAFELEQNYPNPFNTSTTIKITLPAVETGHAPSLQTSLIVYDILGREVATLVNQKLQPGNHEVTFDASNLPAGKSSLSSGVYYYTLTQGTFRQSRKMILVK